MSCQESDVIFKKCDWRDINEGTAYQEASGIKENIKGCERP